MEWISVKDRLPESNVDVKIKFESGIETIGFYKKREKGQFRPAFSKTKFHNRFVNNPSHWQPLPEPPK